jgi:polyferredoxin
MLCPWPRIQAALTDEWALNVTYRWDRGEPRMSVKHAKELEAGPASRQAIVSTATSVSRFVRPASISAKVPSSNASSAGLCIDACDTVMDKIDRPRGLIGYDHDMNIERHARGEKPIYRFIRARTIIYGGIILLTAGIMAFALATRNDTGIAVIHDRNPLFVTQQDGSIRNGYTVRLVNRDLAPREFTVAVEGLPGARVEVVGVTATHEGRPLVAVNPSDTREVRVLVFAPQGAALQNPYRSRSAWTTLPVATAM